jgi:CDP-diacylglycerol pyrophosphatase
MKPSRCLLIALALIAGGCVSDAPETARSGGNPNALRTIVLDCLDAKVADYCARCPSPLEGKCGVDSCWVGTEVWAETAQFVAIRDRKMCQCPPGFVHGLALPRESVTGIEDPRRPDGIWPFAWQVALARIAAPAEIVLAVNSPYQRTQNQLHVHIVRLLPDGRARIEARKPVRIEKLEDAWRAAATHAKRMGYSSYGMAVAQAEGGGYLVVSTDVSPEYQFTQTTCGAQRGPQG